MKVSIKDSQFYGNESLESGGAIFNHAAILAISSSSPGLTSFVENICGESYVGSAILNVGDGKYSMRKPDTVQFRDNKQGSANEPIGGTPPGQGMAEL